MENKKWHIIRDGGAWIEVIYLSKEDSIDEYWSYASVKWDGCINYSQAGNIPYSKECGLPDDTKRDKNGACDDYIHICDIDEIIEKLTKLRDILNDRFPGRLKDENI